MVLFIYGQVNSFVLVALKPPPKKQIDHLVETFDLDDSGASCVLRLASCVLRLAPCAVRRAPCAVRRAPCAVRCHLLFVVTCTFVKLRSTSTFLTLSRVEPHPR